MLTSRALSNKLVGSAEERLRLADRLIYDGTRHQVIALELADGSCPAREFLHSLGDSDRAKVAAIIQRVGDHRRVNNREKFKKVEDTSVFEIKSHQIRVFCFFSPDRRLVLLDPEQA